MTPFFYDVSLHCRTAETLSRAYYRQILTVLEEFDPLNVFGHRTDPEGTSLRDCA